jgi:hypothetical protein
VHSDRIVRISHVMRRRWAVVLSLVGTSVAAIGVSVAVADTTTTLVPVPVNPSSPQSSCSGLPGSVPTSVSSQVAGSCDTPYTPLPQACDPASCPWTYVGGLKFGDTPHADGSVPGSPTPASVNFFSVAFGRPGLGFAGGSTCDPDPSAGYTKPQECLNPRPVMWKYTQDANGRGSWVEDASFDASLPAGKSGFVGAIAFDPGTDRAVAVGGTGSYPYYEQVIDQTHPDPAGQALAWEYDGSSWQSVPVPSTMGGLTALALSPRPDDCEAKATECGFAGGYQQIWRWETKPGSLQPFTQEPVAPTYRVRSIKFAPQLPAGVDDAHNKPTIFYVAFAVTSGCCTPPSAAGTQSPVGQGQVLGFDRGQQRWTDFDVYESSSPAPQQNGLRGLPDSIYSMFLELNNHLGPVLSFVLSPAEPPCNPSDVNQLGCDPRGAVTSRVAGCVSVSPGAAAKSGQLASAGDETVGNGGGCRDVGVGGDAGADEPLRELFNPRVADLRLTAADGDVLSAPGAKGTILYPAGLGGRNGPVGNGSDGVVDWAVGEITSSGQSAAYTTTTETDYSAGVLSNVPDPLASGNCGLGDEHNTAALVPDCTPDVAGAQAQEVSRSTFLLPTFALNAYTFTSTGGVGWAVGDRGALMELGSSATAVGAASSVPNPALLGAAAPGALPETAAYRPFEPQPSPEPGLVPPLASMPQQPDAGWQLVDEGSPDLAQMRLGIFEPPVGGESSVGSIAMSRDGSEGWAAGSNPLRGFFPFSLYHYSDGQWRPCRPVADYSGPAEPACEGLASSATYDYGQVPKMGVDILAVARVPLEYGNDAAQANDFQAVAVATGAKPINGDDDAAMLFRYARGRWEIDRPGTSQLAGLSAHHGNSGNSIASIAFGSPTDGWLVTGPSGGIRHFVGGSIGWGISCGGSNESTSSAVGNKDWACDDPSGRLTDFDSLATPGSVNVMSVGRRLYMYGEGSAANTSRLPFVGGPSSVTVPIILYRDSDKPCDPGDESGCWQYANGGLDPVATGQSDPDQQGQVASLSVVRNGDGSYSGWAYGWFGVGSSPHHPVQAALLHLHDGVWSPWSAGDAVADYWQDSPSPVSGPPTLGPDSPQVMALPGASGEGRAVLTSGEGFGAGSTPAPFLSYDPAAGGRWEPFATPFSLRMGSDSDQASDAYLDAMAPDGQGGFWLALHPGWTFSTDYAGQTINRPVFFYHYTDRVPKPVFSDVEHPVREAITATGTGGDGSFWVGTAGGSLYRHDRATGWAQLRVPGWQPGNATTGAEVRAVAVGLDGRGIVVGDGGRIADVSPLSAVLDPAAARKCLEASCHGTSYDLDAAAVAPDGSEVVAGAGDTVLLRSRGGVFTRAPVPQVSGATLFTAASFPNPDRVWLTTQAGEVVAGVLDGDKWSWRVEDQDSRGRLPNDGPLGFSLGLHAIAIDAAGQGFAVGEHGLVLERTVDGVWRRLDTGFDSNFWSVAMPAGGGPGVLIGGEWGLILTYVGGRFQVAHQADPFDGLTAANASAPSRVVGLGLAAGDRPGEVEAWAAEQMPDVSQAQAASSDRGTDVAGILHYSSDPSDPLLSAGARVKPLPDAPASSAGDVSLAVFGKSECQQPTADANCPEPVGSNELSDLVDRRIVGAISSLARTPVGPAMALFTGDVDDSASRGADPRGGSLTTVDVPMTHSLVFDNWIDLVADPLRTAGVPVFGAVGGQDLSRVNVLNSDKQSSLLNDPWRGSFAGMPLPWGALKLPDGSNNKPPPDSHGFSFEPVAFSGQERPEVPTQPVGIAGQTTPNLSSVPGGPGPQSVGPESVGAGQVAPDGAHTHYAFDIERGGSPVLRVVVVDSSRGSLTASDAEQNPIEVQLKWLADVLGSRPAGERAVVVSETPSYSYGPGSGTNGPSNDTLADSAAFETLMATDRVDAVISGRLGWNGLYYTSTVAPGLHCPEPGGSYPDPSTGCSPTAPGGSQSAENQAAQGANRALGTVAGALADGGAPAPPPSDNVLGAYPTVVSASAGGKFGPADQDQSGQVSGTAEQGFWHGYAIVRIEPSGSVVVEQRPVLDWVGIIAIEHTLQPGQHLQLHGFGREPVGTDAPIQYDDISSPAITHRFDLVEADPAQPWLPLVDPSSPSPNHYVPLDPSVATIDRQTGFVQTGSGSHPRVYAIAILSVGDRAASWPMVFQPRRSFVSRPSILPQLPPIVPPAQLPPAHLAAIASAPPPPPTSPPPAPPEVATPNLPQLPVLTPPPPVAGVTPPTPPPPPAPPPPPSQPTPLPLALQAKLTPVGINATVVPPAPPPVNPAPPSGSAARKEAKQRQAATAQSEEGSAGEQTQQAGGDLAQERIGSPDAFTRQQSPMTRRSRERPVASFTLTASSRQPSAWSQDVLYGGGLLIAGLVLAMAFSTVRPTSRRRPREVAAPAWARRGRRGG